MQARALVRTGPLLVCCGAATPWWQKARPARWGGFPMQATMHACDDWLQPCSSGPHAPDTGVTNDADGHAGGEARKAARQARRQVRKAVEQRVLGRRDCRGRWMSAPLVWVKMV